ncbi:NlpC/P60 family protein [Flavobacterium sp.]|uniref:peptidoglycan endopeptidase n=1 Tax=Flavobacterium sp. TaxID=239 RepID=UPI0038FC8926
MKQITLLLFFFITINVFSQENNIKHIVAKGESMYQIAKKYKVKQEDIFKLNPNSKNKLKLNSVLLIPKEETNLGNTTELITHEVLPKQTLYGISKQYKVSIEDIKNANPIIEKEGLEIGLKLSIPVDKNQKKEKVVVSEPSKSIKKIESEKQIVISNDDEIRHLVLPKETKYGISKKYKISISELENLNPEIMKDLPIGFNLLIKKGNKKEVVISEIPVVQETKNNGEIKVKEEVKSQIEEETDEENTVTPQIRVVEIIPHNDDEVVVKPLSVEGMTKAELLIAKASENIGTRYRSGGTNKDGFDCSGLMINTFKEIAVDLPRTSAGQSTYGIRIDRDKAQKGDLIFFTTNGRGNINHVGMIVEILDNEIKFIHSSVHAGVIISSTKEDYYTKRFIQVNRVLE